MKRKVVLGILCLFFSILCIPKGANATTSSQEMHRLYNPNSGEHFYTANTNEKNHLTKVGWRYEGIGWVAPTAGSAVYRLYNKNAGDHHYTMNANEKNHLIKVGWKYEGVGWYSDTKKTVPLYRAYNPNAKAGSHNYTVNYGEQQNLLKHGWKNEGIAWYGVNKTVSVVKHTVTIKHVGSDGKVLKTSTASVEKGKKYTAKSGIFSGYSLSGTSTQTVTVNGNKTITFKYTKNPTPVTKYNVTVVHKGLDGKTLETEKAVQVEKGTYYTAKAKSFSGYTLRGASSQMVTINGNKTITFNYTKNPAPVTKYNVTVVHKGSDGKTLETEPAVQVEKGTYYTVMAKSFNGYTLNGSRIQSFTVDGNKMITFNYTKNPAPVTKYNVTVVHKGSDGKTLETEPTVQVEKGTYYTVKAKSFSGYTLNGSTIQSFTVDGNKTITFNYTKQKEYATITFIIKDQARKEIGRVTKKVELIDGKYSVTLAELGYGDEYTYVQGNLNGSAEKDQEKNVTIYVKTPTISDNEKQAAAFYDEFMSAVNDYRQSEGFSEIVHNDELQKGADIRAKDLASNFSHTRPDGSSYMSAFKLQNTGASSVGECIFRGSAVGNMSAKDAAAAVLKEWQNSSEHDAIILKSKGMNFAIGFHIENGTVYMVLLIGSK